jgi:prevent-host-death family protein
MKRTHEELRNWQANLKKVPASKFRREMKKWLRIVEQTGEPIIITHRNLPSVVLMPVSLFEKMVDI